MQILYTILTCLGCILLGYLFGSIPNGVIIGKIHGINIRDYGSHNTGGTNVGRTLGKKAGILTMVLDALKCYIPLLILLLILTYTPLNEYLIDYSHKDELFLSITAFFVLIGHTFPIFAHFQGGKAVSSMAGYIFFISPILFVSGIIIFFILFKISHKISVCSIITVPSLFLLSLVPMVLDLTVLPEITSFNGGLYYSASLMVHLSYITSIFLLLGACLIVYRHKSNILRIRKHEEPETHFENTIEK
jgi:acyl phosphate:glycerol-3-phosphate acyltransferase